MGGIMATWREEFAELSATMKQQMERWEDGERNHLEVRDALDAISEFLRQYIRAGDPKRDTERHTP